MTVEYVKTIAKALVAVLTVILSAIVAGQLNVEPWVETLLASIVAGLAVWAVPNSSAT